jgi:hypothetical protein
MLFCLRPVYLIVRYVLYMSQQYLIYNFVDCGHLPCFCVRHVTSLLRGAHLLIFPVNNIIPKSNTGTFRRILKCFVSSNCTKRGSPVL